MPRMHLMFVAAGSFYLSPSLLMWQLEKRIHQLQVDAGIMGAGVEKEKLEGMIAKNGGPLATVPCKHFNLSFATNIFVFSYQPQYWVRL